MIKSSFVFEKEIFLSLYIIRKLIESENISTNNKNLKVSCFITPSNGKNVHRFNTSSVDRLYNFPKTKKANIRLNDLCNQIIHSYIFDPTFDLDQKLVGFWVSSQYKRHTALYSFILEDIIDVLELIGKDYPNYMNTSYDLKKRDYIIEQYMIDDSKQK